VLDGDCKFDASERLSMFYRLEEGYFSDNSFFEYRGDYIRLSCSGRELKQTIAPVGNEFDYRKSKNIYIPAERSFVSAVPNLGRYNETNDNVMNFVYDWYSAKRRFTNHNMLPILDLGADFYSNEKTDSDVLFLREKRLEISLRSGSSGIQSLVPLMANVEYLTRSIYDEEASMSVNETRALAASFAKPSFAEYARNGNPLPASPSDAELAMKKTLEDVAARRKSYHAANLIVEEPEQNLFPRTQRDLIYYLFNRLQSEREHSLLLTTHSPYILYAVNNCLIGAVIARETTPEERAEFASADSWMSPDKVNLLEMDERSGTMRSIKNPRTGTVDKHYFNFAMKEIMQEYYDMLSFYSDET
jgi:hypothetical protein